MIEVGHIEVTHKGRVAEIRLNRPEKRNAMDLAMCRDLVRAITECDEAASVGAMVLSGHGGTFCAGMDLKDSLAADPMELASTHEWLFTMIRRVRTPIIAAVHGVALGAGFGIAANAHIIFAAPDARFGLPEIRIGVWPILVFRAIEEAIGQRRTLELGLTGRFLNATDAISYGLVAEVMADPVAKARTIADAIASSSLPAVAAGLEYLERTRGLDWTAAGQIGQEVRDRLMKGEDYREGVAAFLEKRSPVWPSLE